MDFILNFIILYTKYILFTLKTTFNIICILIHFANKTVFVLLKPKALTTLLSSGEDASLDRKGLLPSALK